MRARPQERELTPAERNLVRWMLEHGEPDALSYLAQLEQARVTPQRCACGCASLYFAIAGRPEPTGGLRPLADFVFGSQEDLKGIFVYEQEGVLAGLEVYGLMGEAPKALPNSEELEPFDTAAD